MKNIISTILILLFAFSLHAQSSEINWEKTFKEKGTKYNNLRPIGHTDKHYYILNQPRKNQDIIQYDFNHKLKKYTTLNLDKNIKVNQLINTASGNYLLSSQPPK